MKRIITQEAAHPSEHKLDLIKNESVSLQERVNRLKGDLVSVRKEIDDSNKLKLKAKNDRVIAEIELGDVRKTIVDEKKYLGDLDAEILLRKKSIVSLTREQENIEHAIIEGVNKLTEQRKTLDAEFKNKENLLDKLIKEHEVCIINLRKEETLIVNNIRKLSDEINVNKRLVSELEKDIVAHKAELDFLGKNIRESLELLKDTSDEADVQQGRVNNLIREIEYLNKKLVNVELVIKEGEKKIQDQKEIVVGLVQREERLKLAEEKMQEIYKRAGLNL